MLIFGKIDYINLLPLHIYLKKAPLPSTFKQIMAHKKGVPSVINYKLKKGASTQPLSQALKAQLIAVLI